MLFGVLLSMIGGAVVFLLPWPLLEYEASSTLVRMPPTYQSELRPSLLDLYSFKEFFESDSVLQESRRRLVERGIFKPGQPLRLGSDIRIDILTSHGGDTVLAPILEVVARRPSQEEAIGVVDVCTKVFLESTQRFRETRQGSTLEIIEQHFSTKQQTLEALELERTELLAQGQRQLDAKRAEWDHKIVRQMEKTTDLIQDFQEETGGLMKELARQLGQTLQTESGLVSPDVVAAILRLTVLRTRLAQNPEWSVRRKVFVAEGSLLEPIWMRDREMKTQEIDPIYTDLVQRVAALEFDLESKIVDELPGSRSATLPWMAELESRQRQRGAKLVSLEADREESLVVLKKQRQQDLRRFREQLALDVERLDRKIRMQARAHKALAGMALQANLARAEEDLPDILIGTRPTTAKPVLWRGWLFFLIAAILVGMVALAIRVQVAVRRLDPKAWSS